VVRIKEQEVVQQVLAGNTEWHHKRVLTVPLQPVFHLEAAEQTAAQALKNGSRRGQSAA